MEISGGNRLGSSEVKIQLHGAVRAFWRSKQGETGIGARGADADGCNKKHNITQFSFHFHPELLFRFAGASVV